MTQPLSRRTLLRGLGTAVALPFLDAMTPRVAAAARAAAPSRIAWFFIPNGVNMAHWRPGKEGAGFSLPPSLEPLKSAKDYLTVFSGLTLDNARAKGDGPGDHARSAAAFLTGAHPFKTAGANIRLGVSADQFAARKIGNATRFPSLELGLDRSDRAGNCDSGYACAYVSNISWASETTPMPKEINPTALFDRMFGTGDKAALEARSKRQRYQKSVLDMVAQDTRDLAGQLGSSDRHKLDEYTTAIREIERRIDRSREELANLPRPEIDRPEMTPKEMAEHMKIMCDLLWLAWRSDLTRVSTIMIARDGSNRSYPWLGVREGHHSISHHGNNPDKIAAIRKIDQFHVRMFGYFIEKLRTTQEGDGNMLDHSLVMLGSGISDGDRHNHDDLPVLLLGKGNGAVKPGRHLTYPRNTPLCNLYLSMLDSVNVRADRFGDSTGRLAM